MVSILDRQVIYGGVVAVVPVLNGKVREIERKRKRRRGRELEERKACFHIHIQAVMIMRAWHSTIFATSVANAKYVCMCVHVCMLVCVSVCVVYVCVFAGHLLACIKTISLPSMGELRTRW